MKEMSSDNVIVCDLLQMLTKKISESRAQLNNQELGMALYGLQVKRWSIVARSKAFVLNLSKSYHWVYKGNE
jgi:hypothetical protein